jgi:RecB family endonuclease NucS
MTTLAKLEDLIYRGFKDTDQKFKETDRLFKEEAARTKELDRLSRVTDRKLKDLIEQVSGLTDSISLFSEHMVKPAVIKLLAKRGIDITNINSRSKGRCNGDNMEWDVLGYGSRHVLAVEVKLRLEQEDVDDALDRLARFFDFFERYRGLILHGAVAGMSIDQGVDRYAYKRGLFVFTQSGENIRLLNDEKFKPRAFGGNASVRRR